MTDLTASVPPMPSGAENCNPPGIGFWPLVAEDFRTHERDPFSQGFWAIAVHRLGNWRMGIRHRLLRAPVTLLYRILYKLVQILGGIDLPYTTIVGRRVKLEHFGGMILVARSIGDDVIIRQNTTFGVRNTRELNGKPIIGNRVDIGAGAVLLGHIRIGDGSVIGANAVVLDDVPPGSLAVGVPARILDRRDRGA
jgi:serine O-acetyltransferase